MDGDLRTAMTSGVFAEFCDDLGHTVGQAVFADWLGRPLPVVGDMVCCHVESPTTGRRRKMLGRVVDRQFDVQRDDAGDTCVWARLLIRTTARPKRPEPSRMRIDFSTN
jgi:hypothetical protein